MTVFEMKAEGNFLKIIPLKIQAEEGIPIVFIDVKIEAKGGPFTGGFRATMSAADFDELKKIFEFIYNRRVFEAQFHSLEHNINIQFKADELGHYTASCKIVNGVDPLSECKFEVNFDQSYIPGFIEQLEKIIRSLE